MRTEDYIFGLDSRKMREIEREQVSKSLMNLMWSKHIQMGCEIVNKGHLEDISALDIDDGDQMILMGSHSGSVSIANYKYLGRKKWKKPMTLNLEKQALKTIKWCPIDMRLFMVTTASNWMRVCDSQVGKVINGSRFDGDVHFHWNQYHTRNSKVAVADGTRTMKIVDFRIGMSLPSIIRWEDIPIDVVQWFPSKHHYVYMGRRDGKIGIFDIRSTRGTLAEAQLHSSPIFEMRITSDGSRIITADRSGYFHVADTWNFSKKSEFIGTPLNVSHRRPSMELLENQQDLFLAVNLDKLTVIKFPWKGTPEYSQLEPVVLSDKPMVFRKTSSELITGHSYNYLNVLSRRLDDCEIE